LMASIFFLLTVLICEVLICILSMANELNMSSFSDLSFVCTLQWKNLFMSFVHFLIRNEQNYFWILIALSVCSRHQSFVRYVVCKYFLSVFSLFFLSFAHGVSITEQSLPFKWAQFIDFSSLAHVFVLELYLVL
jgi:hypothetical protein